ncbi:MAG: hypothetical protein AB2L09_00095 [Coriobacteriia bacterium]
MKAVHIRVEGISNDESAVLAEKAVSRLDGVKRVVAVKALELMSVMYDEHRTNRSAITKALKAIGLRAKPFSSVRASS